MSDSVQSHRRQPTMPPRPWDSPGKNTGVGCHFLLQCMKVKSESEATQSCPTLRDPMDRSPPGSSVYGIFQEKYWSVVPLPSPLCTIIIIHYIYYIYVITCHIYHIHYVILIYIIFTMYYYIITYIYIYKWLPWWLSR